MFSVFFGKNGIKARENGLKKVFLQIFFEKALVEMEKTRYSLYTNAFR